MRIGTCGASRDNGREIATLECQRSMRARVRSVRAHPESARAEQERARDDPDSARTHTERARGDHETAGVRADSARGLADDDIERNIAAPDRRVTYTLPLITTTGFAIDACEPLAHLSRNLTLSTEAAHRRRDASLRAAGMHVERLSPTHRHFTMSACSSTLDTITHTRTGWSPASHSRSCASVWFRAERRSPCRRCRGLLPRWR